MGIFKVISALFKLFFVIANAKREKNEEIKEKKKEIIKEAKNAIKNRDASDITDAFDRIRRLH